MLIAFQVILLILIVFFGLGSVGEKDPEQRKQWIAILLAAMISMGFTFYI
ncbi:hypothetical protein RYX45_01405 [Alkalihalophilus pseudofirmus]|uniref:Uncharacterized protein n=1 Tax=Alkalihalophilus pseudofirmus TaxID=79885 RepID=A0AAJ2NJY8_ALKPS|nr:MULTISPECIES: hypothetical protein [Alkalihalophilus]MCM3488798.1 hypothetical protein [Alkalihalophilus marmarensis]MDV2883819.1 hypothetical protein [Alkalihalophilus pseudofirmus]